MATFRKDILRSAGRGERGVTLIELVVTMTVASIVVAFMVVFIKSPVDAYLAQSRRADLVDEADGALRLMARDLRAALPNSVRVTTSGTVSAIELLATVDGARYQSNGVSNSATDLDFTKADGAFATTVPFTQLTLPWTSTKHYVVIYNVGLTGANAYDMANVITPAGTTITITAGATSNQNLVTLSPAMDFSWPSPGNRFYIVSGPVSYLCDTSTGVLTRYSGYLIASAQSTSGAALTAAGAASGVVATDVSNCGFAYSSGTAQRNSSATLTLSLTRSGETIQLFQQVQITNAP